MNETTDCLTFCSMTDHFIVTGHGCVTRELLQLLGMMTLQKYVLGLVHGHSGVIHFGAIKILQCLHAHYYWPGCHTDSELCSPLLHLHDKEGPYSALVRSIAGLLGGGM